LRRRAWPGLLGALALAAGCGKAAPPPDNGANGAPPPTEEPPVAMNPDPPIQYPPRLYDQRVEGEVVLRLFIDATGKLRPESTRVAESSGYPALDSAAVAGAARLRYAPAKRHGVPVGTMFLQPVQFRHQTASAPGAAGGAAAAPPALVPEPRPIAAPPRRIARPRRDTTARPDTTARRDSTTRRDSTGRRAATDTAAPKPVRDTSGTAARRPR
jgi:TonB family protein